MSKHTRTAIWDGLGGAMMGGFMGSVLFAFLGAASIVSGTWMAYAVVAGIPALFMAYREGKWGYDKSRQHARDPVDPAIIAKLNDPMATQPTPQPKVEQKIEPAPAPKMEASPEPQARQGSFTEQLAAQRQMQARAAYR